MSSFEIFFHNLGETKRVVDSNGLFTSFLMRSSQFPSELTSIEIRKTSPTRLLRPFVYFSFSNGVRIRELSSFVWLWHVFRLHRSSLISFAKQAILLYNDDLFHLNNLSYDEEMVFVYSILIDLQISGLPSLKRRCHVQPPAKLSQQNILRFQTFFRHVHNKTFSNREIQTRYQSSPVHSRQRQLQLLFHLTFRDRMIHEFKKNRSFSDC